MSDGSATRGLELGLELTGWSVAACVLLIAPFAHIWWDRPIAEAARSHGLLESQVLQWTTELGEGVWWLAPSAVLFAVAAIQKRHNLARWAFALFVAVAGSGLLTILAKFLSGKTRPKRWFEAQDFGFYPLTYGYDYNSLPSGHATTAGAAAMVLALAFPRAAPVILPLGVLLATTRVAIQAHYLSDICVGLAMGISCAILTFVVWRRWWPASVPRA
jgi:membrane-associated phospholipid phosphatase